jgi:hypothetical protein
MDILVESLNNLRLGVREVEEKQMKTLLDILNPLFSKHGYDLNHKENEPPIFQVGYEGHYESSIRYKSRIDGTLIEFLYQEDRPTPISLSIKAKGIMNRKYEKPRSLEDLNLAVKEALLR